MRRARVGVNPDLRLGDCFGLPLEAGIGIEPIYMDLQSSA